jgi:hypothetical protein
LTIIWADMNVKLYAEVLVENLFNENGAVDNQCCDMHGLFYTIDSSCER